MFVIVGSLYTDPEDAEPNEAEVVDAVVDGDTANVDSRQCDRVCCCCCCFKEEVEDCRERLEDAECRLWIPVPLCDEVTPVTILLPLLLVFMTLVGE